MPPRDGSDDAVNQIKSRLNLVELVGQHVRLRKQGREFTGLCPFHQEKTPSFTVNEQMQSWYCFGCQKGGDIFSFQEQIEKTDFKGALESLAELAGVELQRDRAGGGARSELRKRVLEMNRLAVKYYEYVLWSTPAGEPGRKLLGQREVSEETARRFGLGFAPSGSSFAAYLRAKARSLPDATQAGLVRRDGADFFQERLLIPIRDERGQPLAFTGRTIHGTEPRKYVNSPETPAYVKGRVLFALDLAKEGIAKEGCAVLMEGQFDVIVGHQFGATNAVASSGTALTEEQVRLLKRFTEEIVLVFDNDQAGKAAAFKAIEQASTLGLRTRVGVLADAKDPDEFLRGAGAEAPERWRKVMEEAPAGWEFWIRDSVRGLRPGNAHDREVGIARVHSILARIPDAGLRDTYREQAATWLGVPPHLMTEGRLATRTEPGDAVGEPEAGLAPRRAGNKLSVGRYLLQVLAVRPDAARLVRGHLAAEELDEADRGTYKRMLETLEKGGLEALGSELSTYPPEDEDFVRRAWASPPPNVDDSTVEELIARLKRDSLRARKSDIITRLAEAERQGDSERIAALQAEFSRLSRKPAEE